MTKCFAIHPLTHHPSIHSSNHQFIYLNLHSSSIHTIHSIHPSIHPIINSFSNLSFIINSFIHPSFPPSIIIIIHIFIHPSSIHPIINSFIHPPIHPLLPPSSSSCPYIHPSSIHSSNHQFIHPALYSSSIHTSLHHPFNSFIHPSSIHATDPPFIINPYIHSIHSSLQSIHTFIHQSIHPCCWGLTGSMERRCYCSIGTLEGVHGGSPYVCCGALPHMRPANSLRPETEKQEIKSPGRLPSMMRIFHFFPASLC